MTKQNGRSRENVTARRLDTDFSGYTICAFLPCRDAAYQHNGNTAHNAPQRADHRQQMIRGTLNLKSSRYENQGKQISHQRRLTANHTRHPSNLSAHTIQQRHAGNFHSASRQETWHPETWHPETWHPETWHPETWHLETWHLETWHPGIWPTWLRSKKLGIHLPIPRMKI